jgi:hypothetical protein
MFRTCQIAKLLTPLTSTLLLVVLALPAFSGGSVLGETNVDKSGGRQILPVNTTGRSSSGDMPVQCINTVGESTEVQGVTTAGTVVNCGQVRFESTVQQMVLSVQVGCCLWGLFLIFFAISEGGKAFARLQENRPGSHLPKDQENKIMARMLRGLIMGMSLICLAVMLPHCVNWLVASFRDSAICG